MVVIQPYYEAIWMRKILFGFFGKNMDPMVIYYDNESWIKLSVNLVFHDMSKHIDIWYHHLRYFVHRMIMSLEYIPMEEQDANILTKELSRIKFKFHRYMIWCSIQSFLVERECWNGNKKWHPKGASNLIFP